MAITSSSVTPSACAASAGDNRSGMPVEAGAVTAGAWCHRHAERPGRAGGRRRRPDDAALLHQLLRNREAHGQLAGSAGRAAAARRLHALGHLVLHEVVQVSHGGHARSLVDRGLDLRRHRHVLDDEAGNLQPVLRPDHGVDQGQQRLPELAVARCDIEHRHLGRCKRIAEHADDPRAHRVGELVETEVLVGAGDFLQEQLRVHDLEVERAERPSAHDAEVGIPHHDGVGRAPLVPGEQARGQEVDVGLERRLEAVLPRLQPRENRDVVRGERVLARTERVAELTDVDELRHLRLAHDQLCASLDGLVIVREAVRERVTRVVRPLDDFEQLALQEIHDAHRCLRPKLATRPAPVARTGSTVAVLDGRCKKCRLAWAVGGRR